MHNSHPVWMRAETINQIPQIPQINSDYLVVEIAVN